MSRRNGLLGDQEGFMTHNSKDHITDVWKLFLQDMCLGVDFLSPV